ncbi:hypothetical protein AAG570_011268 [Ranatra chinensis]|uniref:Uncharacterized protein n=1 Tax=Ranatra chinensis TaxID=642074 RepID=A0ABD0YK73_9HEMI
MASKRRNMFQKNKKEETAEIGEAAFFSVGSVGLPSLETLKISSTPTLTNSQPKINYASQLAFAHGIIELAEFLRSCADLSGPLSRLWTVGDDRLHNSSGLQAHSQHLYSRFRKISTSAVYFFCVFKPLCDSHAEVDSEDLQYRMQPAITSPQRVIRFPIASIGCVSFPTASIGFVSFPTASIGYVSFPIASIGFVSFPTASIGFVSFPAASIGYVSFPAVTQAEDGRILFYQNKKQETAEIGTSNLPPFCACRTCLDAIISLNDCG